MKEIDKNPIRMQVDTKVGPKQIKICCINDHSEHAIFSKYT